MRGEWRRVEPGSPDRRRFFASLLAGQITGVVALVLLGGVLAPAILAFMGAAAGCFVVAEPRRAA
jgi:hypothetical protein